MVCLLHTYTCFYVDTLGAFGGDKQWKAVQQLIAASEAGFDLIYSTFKENQFKASFQAFLDFVGGLQPDVTVGQLYCALESFQPSKDFSQLRKFQIFEHVQKALEVISKEHSL